MLFRRAGARGSGTLVQLSLPVTLSYNGNNWCLDVSCDLTALKLSARIYYQRWNLWSWEWGELMIFEDFGTWAAIEKKWQVISKCPSPPHLQVAKPDEPGWGEWIWNCFGKCYGGILLWVRSEWFFSYFKSYRKPLISFLVLTNPRFPTEKYNDQSVMGGGWTPIRLNGKEICVVFESMFCSSLLHCTPNELCHVVTL